MNVLGPILIGLLLAAGVFAAIRFWHKLITRIVTVIAGLGIAWLAVLPDRVVVGQMSGVVRLTSGTPASVEAGVVS